MEFSQGGFAPCLGFRVRGGSSKDERSESFGGPGVRVADGVSQRQQRGEHGGREETAALTVSLYKLISSTSNSDWTELDSVFSKLLSQGFTSVHVTKRS